jgi:hypothetical protein
MHAVAPAAEYWFPVHAVQDPEFAAEYVPASHGVHSLFVVVVQAVISLSPAAHVALHVVQLAAPAAEKLTPAVQDRQPLSAVAEQPLLWYWPAGHPPLHAVHCPVDLEKYCPPGQDVHDVAPPPREYDPAGQALHEKSWHALVQVPLLN